MNKLYKTEGRIGRDGILPGILSYCNPAMDTHLPARTTHSQSAAAIHDCFMYPTGAMMGHMQSDGQIVIYLYESCICLHIGLLDQVAGLLGA